MRKCLLLFLLVISLPGCSSELTPEEVRIQEYGALYATMDCGWSSQELMSPALFWCAKMLDTDLIKGYIRLAIEEDLEGEQYLSICGEEITLNSGYNLHDTLIATMTQYTYSCYDSYERSLGNEFDWIWDSTTSTLQLIWRPDEELHKVLTLFIPEKGASVRVSGTVYYKTGYFN